MPQGYDGSIKIDARLETKNFYEQLKKLKDNLDKMFEGQTVSIELQTNDVQNELKSLNKDINNLNEPITKTNKFLGAMLKKLLAIVSIKTFINLSKQAVTLASQLEEVQNVVDVTFGKMADSVNEISKNAIYSLGMSEITFKQYASSLATMAKIAELSEEAAYGMSVELTELIGNMSSFYNVSQDVAKTAVQSIFTGETRALKRFGIVMTEATLESYALSKGIEKSLDSMTQSEKVQLRYAYLMEHLNFVSGDFIRTQDSWANQIRLLNENLKDLGTTIGKDLIELLKPLVKFLNILIISFKELYLIIRSFYVVEDSIETVSEELSETTQGLIEDNEELAQSYKEIENAVKRVLLGFDDLTILQNKASETGGDLGLNDFTDVGLEENTQQISGFKQTLQEIALFLKPLLDLLKSIGSSIVKTFKLFFDMTKRALEILNDYFSPLGDVISLALQGLKRIFDFFTNIYDKINESSVAMDAFGVAIAAALTALGILAVSNPVGAIIVGVVALIAALEALIQNWDNVVQFFKDTGQDIGDFFSKLFDDIGFFFKNFWNDLTNGFKLFVNDIIRFINGLISAITNGINSILGALNKIKINIPDWVPGIGGKTWGFNIKSLSAPQIPYLAKGAVIPPNSEFMAVLGDQKTGTNIETPESLLRQIYREESNNGTIINLLVELIGTVKQGMTVNLDGRKLARGMKPYNDEMKRIKGGY